jgi:hypothetical protein
MYEVTVTFTRQDDKEDFFVFNVMDKDLLFSHNRFRNEALMAPGFISLSYVISDDKMKLKVITLWESIVDGQNFMRNNKFGKEFYKWQGKYLARTGTLKEVSTEMLPDTEAMKAKKLSTRITIDDANQALLDFLNDQRIVKYMDEHVVFFPDDYDEQEPI